MKKKSIFLIVLGVVILVVCGFIFVPLKEKNEQKKVAEEFITNLYTINYDTEAASLLDTENDAVTTVVNDKIVAVQNSTLDNYVKEKFKSLLTTKCYDNSYRNRILTTGIFESLKTQSDLSVKKITQNSREKTDDIVKLINTVEVSHSQDEKQVTTETHEVTLYLFKEDKNWEINTIQID